MSWEKLDCDDCDDYAQNTGTMRSIYRWIEGRNAELHRRLQHARINICMKRDTIFYRIFQQNPTLLFDLLPTQPANAQDYTFASIEVKETSFRIDGVLLPPTPDGTIIFSEVQMQPDGSLYERLFSEIGIYTYRHPETFADWQAIVIYPDRSIEQPSSRIPRELFESGRIQPIYLNELGAIEQLPLGIGLLVLTVLEGETAIAQAQSMAAKAKRIPAGDAIMEMLSTILFYKFKTFSRDEVNAMLGYTLDELKESRAYQEIYTEGREEGQKKGLEEGREKGQLSLILMLLNAKFGQLSQSQQAQIQSLTTDQLQALGIALLEFTDMADLQRWFDRLG
jgi:predicted transposase/invertase (TIGR01784 family)